MYSLRVLREALKDVAGLPKDYARLVSGQIDRLGEHPRPPGAKKLHGGGYRVRVGVYRVLYDVDDEAKTVTVYRVRHRKDAYR